MSVQIGTVDGLINITEDKIRCFVNAIMAFSNGGIQYAKANNVPFGTAFQRFVEPVYTKVQADFDISNILKPVYTRGQNEQSPARITFCRKMGLLNIDEQNSIFELTPLAEELYENNISIEEYAFILLTKQGVFKDGKYVQHLFTFISKWFESNPIISESNIKDYICKLLNDTSIEKTRTDIIINALALCGLVTNINSGIYVLSNLKYARIFSDFIKNKEFLTQSYRDDEDNYTEYIGSFKFGIFDILTSENLSIYTEKYPNLIKYAKLSKREDDGNSKSLGMKLQNPTSLQQIYYGAPGTGKSNKIKEQEGSFAEVYRTTFHPDSDYSTFVGCYKPAMTNSLKVYSADELIDKLSQIKSTGTTYPCHKWAAKYWESLKDISASEIRRILEACELTDSMTTEVSKGIAMGEMFAKNTEHKKIVYSFSAQAFTKAYIEAWEKYTSDDENKNVLLVIEEINRGNCAQIFGDLFQLLDRREDGFSDYPIDADQDLQKYIAENGDLSVSGVYDCNGKDISEEINSGKKLMLPPNLYIWATMNTSDQSLFPIDSAFKRRWDWVYMPIDTEAKTGWKIKVGDKDYSWSSFLEKINDEIQSATSSEDKQLGFFFCKADENGDISAEKFVSKVLFFIYNDVFKDYGLDREFFREKDKDNKPTDKKITFQSMFEKNGDVKDVRVAQLLDNLGVEVVGVSSTIEEEEEQLSTELKDKLLRFWTGFNQARTSHTEFANIRQFGIRLEQTKLF